MMNVLPHVAKLGGMALDLLFPQRCIGCGQEGDFICESCVSSIPRIMPPLCPMCGRPQASGVICPHCVSWQVKISGIRSPFRFDGVIRQAVYQLKYRNLRALAKPLAQMLCDYLTANPIPGDILVPVPLHGERLRERGYNQSELLSRELGKITGRPVVKDALIRNRPTPPQARTANVAERTGNVAGAFTSKNGKLREVKVLLIDDVSTSGATFEACAVALKAAGAASVWGLSLTREI